MAGSFCHHVEEILPMDPRDTPTARALAAHIVDAGGRLTCCEVAMEADGGCSLGCCDYFRCPVCHRRQVCEYGD